MPLIDARTLPEASLIQADVVIIGGGMAGLAIAREFAGTAASVCILESGGLEIDREIQALYDGPGLMAAPGNPDVPMDDYLGQSRVRALGGSGHVWGGKVGPLDEADFAHRPWIARSGWPLDRRGLKPFYDRACDLLHVPRFPVDDALPEGQILTPVTAADAPLRSVPRFYSPVSGRADPAIFDAWRMGPGDAANIAVHLNINVTAIRLDAAGAVDRLELRCLNGATHTARGRTYVLATGGVENARLLLASDVGNAHDLVGRHFMGHVTMSTDDNDPRGDAAVCVTTPADLSLYDNQPRDRAHCVLALDAAAQRAIGAGNCTATLTFRREGPPTPTGDRAAVAQLAGRLDSHDAPPRMIDFYLMSEHLPNPDSRITLSDQTDPLGQPRARMEWRYDQAAWDSLSASVTGLGRAVGAEGLGRLCWPMEPDSLLKVASPSRHHMGTTRMDADPARGVVDTDCRVHGVDNLYVAGSSVFPTAGLINPTLTLIALALRLSDHLKIVRGIA